MGRWWKVLLQVAPVCLCLYVLYAVVSGIVAEPWRAVWRHLGDLGQRWPLRYLPPEPSWGLPAWGWVALSCAAMGFLYLLLRSAEAKRSRTLPLDGEEYVQAPITSVVTSWRQARVFVDAVVNPEKRFERITESVAPYTRSLNVKTTFTARVDDILVGSSAVLPVLMSKRGRLENSIRFIDDEGNRVSSLNKNATNAYIVSCIRKLIRAAGPLVECSYRQKRKTRTVGVKSAGSRRGARVSIDDQVVAYVRQTTTEGNDSAAQAVALALLGQIYSLPWTPRESLINDVAALIWALRLDYPICIVVSRPELDRTKRITVERRIIPEVLQRVPKSRKVLQGAQNPSRGTRIGAWAGRVVASTLDWTKRAAGVTSSTLTYDLENAARAKSYHLEMAGPEGYYASRQRIVDDLGLPVSSRADLGAQSVEHSPLRGQRHTHLYLRSATQAGGFSFQAFFNERTPGSMFTSAGAALATFVITLILAVSQVRASVSYCERLIDADLRYACLTTNAANTGSSDSLLQILLTLPIALIATSFARNSSVWGGVFVARFSNSMIIVLTLCSLALSTLASAFSPRGLSVTWIVLLGLMAVVLLGAFFSWLQRTFVHMSYVTSKGIK